MIVNWKKEKGGINVIPLMTKGVTTDNIILLQGHNEIDDEVWANLKKQTAVKKHIMREDLVEVFESAQGEKGKDKDKDKKITNIHQMSAGKSKEIIKDTWDLTTLDKWLNGESRNDVRSIVHNQIEAVNNPVKQLKGSKK